MKNYFPRPACSEQAATFRNVIMPFNSTPSPAAPASFLRWRGFKLNLLSGLIALIWAFSLFGAPALADEKSSRSAALKDALIEQKTTFKTKTGRLKDPEKLMLEGLRTTALAWSLAAEYAAEDHGEADGGAEQARARAAFIRAWDANNRPEQRVLAATALYYQALTALTTMTAKDQGSEVALAQLKSVADEISFELENSVYVQRKSTIYINALALRVMPLLVKLKAGPQTRARLDQEINLALREAQFLAARTDIHLRGRFFSLYTSGVRLLVRSSFLLAEDPNLGLTQELEPIREVWQNTDADQNDPAGLAVAMGALALTSLPLAYGLAGR